MIVVKAEVWPHGAPPDSEYGKRIAERVSLDVFSLIIVNDATGTFEFGNYDIYAGDPLQRSTWNHRGRIEHFERARKQSHAAQLVHAALEAAL